MEIAQLPSQKRKNLIIIAILVIGLPLITFAAYQVVQLITGAGGNNKPRNVVISNLTTSSITISWTTETQSTGSVIPIENGNSKSPVVDKRGTSRRYTHYVELTSLEPNTKYNFQIVSDSTKYSAEGGKDFSFKTAPITADTPTPNPIYGSVSGGSSDDVILYALLKDKSAYPVSATIPSGGNWIMDLSALRGIADKKMISTSNSSNLVIIAVGGGGKGASVQGIYSDIFDSNGKLKDTNPLALSAKTDMYKSIPSEALLTAYATDNTTPTPTPSKPTPPPTQPEEEEEEEEEVVFNRRFRLVQQLQWIDMVGGGSSVTGKTGAESIQVANLTDTGFSVIWVSEQKEQGTVKYGTSKTSLSNTATDQRDGLTTKGNYYVHLVDITRIQPETTYYYEVVSGSNTYDNNGAKYSLKTFATLSSPPPFESITGQVSNLPDHGEVVVLAYIQDVDSSGSSGDSTKMATFVDDNGKWILSIGDCRTQNGSSYYEYTSGDSMKINLVTTFDTSLTTERMEGIAERDVDIALAESSGSSGSNNTVSALNNYGILGASNGTSLPVNSTPSTNNYVVDGTGQTPQTGILDNMLYLLVFSGGLIGVSYFVYNLGKPKKRNNSKMSKNL